MVTARSGKKLIRSPLPHCEQVRARNRLEHAVLSDGVHDSTSIRIIKEAARRSCWIRGFVFLKECLNGAKPQGGLLSVFFFFLFFFFLYFFFFFFFFFSNDNCKIVAVHLLFVSFSLNFLAAYILRRQQERGHRAVGLGN